MQIQVANSPDLACNDRRDRCLNLLSRTMESD
jgi:hypothetical protein